MRFATFLQPHFILYIEIIIKNYTLISSSGTLYIGTNGTITVSGSNYGALSCSSSNTNIATCSVSGTTVTIVPKAAGSATITVNGAGGTNYNSISKTYAATVQVGTTYVYWIDKGGQMNMYGNDHRMNANHATAVNTSSQYIYYSSTPSTTVCDCKYSVEGCSKMNYCAMMRDVFIANKYDHREVCLWDIKNNKLFCIQHGYYTGNMATTKTKLQSDMTTAFGTAPSNCYAYSDGTMIYCSYPLGDQFGGTGMIRINSNGSIASNTNYSGNYMFCSIGPLDSTIYDTYCDA